MAILIAIDSACQSHLEAGSGVVVHQKKHPYQCSKQTSSIRDNCIDFGKTSSKYIAVSSFSKDNTGIPVFSDFLHRYPGRQHNNAASFFETIRIGEDTVVSCDGIVRNEDVVGTS